MPYDLIILKNLRSKIIEKLGAKIGKNIKIGSNVIIRSPDKLIIRDNTTINDKCFIDAYGGLEIGEGTSIAHDTTILTSSHTVDLQFRTNKLINNSVKIGNNVWIGCKSVIISNINNNTIVGACSFVNKEFDEMSILIGSPAVFLRYIDE